MISTLQQLLSQPGPTAKMALLTLLEAAFNRALQYDPGSRSRLNRIDKQSLLINIRKPDWTIALQADNGCLRLKGYDDTPSAEISGRAESLLAWLISGKSSLADFDIEVRGSTHLLIEWQAFISQLEIDWIDCLSGVTGDTPAQLLGSAVGQLLDWGGARKRNMADQIMEFLIEERELLPNRALFEDFRQRNQELRLTIDRLEARVAHVREQSKDKHPG